MLEMFKSSAIPLLGCAMPGTQVHPVASCCASRERTLLIKNSFARLDFAYNFTGFGCGTLTERKRGAIEDEVLYRWGCGGFHVWWCEESPFWSPKILEVFHKQRSFGRCGRCGCSLAEAISFPWWSRSLQKGLRSHRSGALFGDFWWKEVYCKDSNNSKGLQKSEKKMEGLMTEVGELVLANLVAFPAFYLATQARYQLSTVRALPSGPDILEGLEIGCWLQGGYRPSGETKFRIFRQKCDWLAQLSVLFPFSNRLVEIAGLREAHSFKSPEWPYFRIRFWSALAWWRLVLAFAWWLRVFLVGKVIDVTRC